MVLVVRAARTASAMSARRSWLMSYTRRNGVRRSLYSAAEDLRALAGRVPASSLAPVIHLAQSCRS